MKFESGKRKPLAEGGPSLPYGSRIRHALHLLRSVLGEIFDESAYGRFLARTGMVPSSAAYRVFRHEHELTKARRPRCC